MVNNVKYSFKRYEKKYFLTPSQYEKFIELIKDKVLTDPYGSYTVCNIYYDTDDWRLIRASVEKPYYKEKLRVRSYGVPKDGDTVFAEIKKKCGGVVYKRRISLKSEFAEEYLENPQKYENFGQIGNEIAYFQKFYGAAPKVFIAYDRTAFFGKEDPDLRITFDRNIRWRNTHLDLRAGDFGQPLTGDNRILTEIKISDSCPLWLTKALSRTGAFPISFSKYGKCYEKNVLGKTAPPVLDTAPENKNYFKEAHFCA